MNRLLLTSAFFFSLALFGNLSAQSPAIQKLPEIWKPAVKQPAAPDIPLVNSPTPHLPNLPVSNRTDMEVFIGNTVYDLQTNSSTMPRLFNFGDGTLSATWTMGLDAAAGYPDRGTGYNHFDGASWMPEPDTRLEASTRTGWPCLVGTADGDEVVVNHIFSAPYSLLQLTKAAGSSTWVEAGVPTGNPPGIVWPRIAVGGPDGNTIHAIAITLPVANGGTTYLDVDGHILYYRSLDGGATWDVQGMVIPGLDNTTSNAHTADAYAIDARGETVAVAVFNDWGDVAVWKSTDNGDTWSSTIVNDFPLDNYVTDAGYTVDDLPPYDPAQPDTLAILTSDNSGAVIIDNNDMVHAFYGRMYVIDVELTDGFTNYYPGTSGIAYWNESFGPDSTRTIVDVTDSDGNGIFDVADASEIALYFTSMTGFPSVGIDEDNNLYLAYSAVMEQFFSETATPNLQHYRHLHVTASLDNGETWTDPIDLINEEIAMEPDLISVYEAVFPSVARLVDDKMHLIYQLDFEPGLALRGDMDAAGSNFISYIGVNVDEFGVTNAKEPAAETRTGLQLSPNPAVSRVNVQVELTEASPARLEVFNPTGQLVRSLDLGEVPAGRFTTNIDLEGLGKGIYLVKFTAGEGSSVRKLVKN